MTEQEYINATNLTKLRSALLSVQNVLDTGGYDCPIDKEVMLNIRQLLRSQIDSVDNSICLNITDEQ